MAIIYLGFNNLKKHKRGVENVIHFQSYAISSKKKYYIYWDNESKISKYEKFICIGIKKDKYWIINLNIILCTLKLRNKNIFIHSHNPLMSLVIIFKTKLLTVHDALYYLNNTKNHRFKNIFWILEKILYLRVGHVHFISKFSKKNSLYFRKNKNSIIYNTSHFESLVPVKTENITHNKILIVRSIEERALIDLILKVAQNFTTENYEFIIAGKGPLLLFYQKKIEELNIKNIKLLGYIKDEDLIRLYDQCKIVLVSAAYGEGFGLPIIEGYLFNKPVIASNVCAIPEIIISKKYLFNNNVDDVINKIHLALNNNNFNFRKYYDENFSNEKLINKVSKLYNELL